MIYSLEEMANHIYLTQVSLSVIMIVFCITMIAMDNTAESRSVYLPILTSIVGVWLPQPQTSPKDTASVSPLASVPLLSTT